MGSQKQFPKHYEEIIPETFASEVQDALEHLKDFNRLQQLSITQMYLRSTGQHGIRQDKIASGKACSEFIKGEIDKLKKDEQQDKRELGQLLHLRYIDGAGPDKAADKLKMARATIYRKLKPSVHCLAEAITKSIKPSLRLENIPIVRPLLEREYEIAQFRKDLEENKSVSISGSSGIGKTALAANIAQKWQEKMKVQPFWFTFIPQINDTLSSVIFALANYLYKQDITSLWFYCLRWAGIKEAGQSEDLQQIITHLRDDLENIHQKRCLFIFDECDCLNKDSYNSPVLQFLKQLCLLVPCLFIGQKPTINTEIVYPLQGLSPTGIDSLLNSIFEESKISDSSKNDFHKYINGNPRFAILFAKISKYCNIFDIKELLNRINHHNILKALVNAVWSRLNNEEQDILKLVSVFPKAFPRQSLIEIKDADKHVDNLIRLELITENEMGEVEILPLIRPYIYENEDYISGDNKKALHLKAAHIRAIYGEYTSAAYHFIESGQLDEAITLWYLYREIEIEQGQSHIAWNLFKDVALEQLSGQSEAKSFLLEIKADLSSLIGDKNELDGLIKDLEVFAWDTNNLDLQKKYAKLLHLRGDYGLASDKYQQIYQTTELYLLQIEITSLRCDSLLNNEEKNEALNQAKLAQFLAAKTLGIVYNDIGEFNQAQTYFEQALAFSQSLNDESYQAEIHFHFARLFASQGKENEANPHFLLCENYYSKARNLRRLATIKLNRTLLFLQKENYISCIEYCLEILPEFNRLGMNIPKARTLANLAEAYFNLERYDEAASYAKQVIEFEDVSSTGVALYILGKSYLVKGDLVNAEQLCRQSVEITTGKDKLNLAYAKKYLGEVYIAQQKTPQAPQELLESYNLAVDMNLRQIEIDKIEELLRKAQAI